MAGPDLIPEGAAGVNFYAQFALIMGYLDELNQKRNENRPKLKHIWLLSSKYIGSYFVRYYNFLNTKLGQGFIQNLF